MMKTSLLVASLVLNLLALSLFGFFVSKKGGIPYLTEKVTLAWSSLFSAGRPTERGQAPTAAQLPLVPPETGKGRPLMQVLKERASDRNFAERELSPQDLSNLLWAACGINRPDGHRTAPSARNVQEFDLYVMTQDGVYVYEPKRHALLSVAAGDFRKHAGRDAYVADAPVNLIYVANLDKINWTREENARLLVASLDVGFIAENVALFCASEGLASVPRLSIDKAALANILKLNREQAIILGTTVGYRK